MRKKRRCAYCQSRNPCFDGKTLAGLPCQHPDFNPGKVRPPTKDRKELAVIEEVRRSVRKRAMGN
jgi:hypothetical protein